MRLGEKELERLFEAFDNLAREHADNAKENHEMYHHDGFEAWDGALQRSRQELQEVLKDLFGGQADAET